MRPVQTNRLVNDIYVEGDDNLFTAIAAYLSAEWFTERADELNRQYFLWHSGNKTLSHVVDNVWGLVTDEDRESVVAGSYGLFVTTIGEGLTYLAGLIAGRFGEKWRAKYELLTMQYDLTGIETLERTETPDITIGETTSASKKRTYGSDNVTDTSSQFKTTVTDSGVESDTNVQGFNSSDYQPQSQVKSQGTTTTEGASDDNTVSVEAKTSGEDTHTDTGTKNRTETGTRTVSESRKRGDITAEIRRALELRDTIIDQMIMDDVDTVLATPYYSV